MLGAYRFGTFSKHLINLRSHPHTRKIPRKFHQQFMFGNFFLCGGERGSLGYLPWAKSSSKSKLSYSIATWKCLKGLIQQNRRNSSCFSLLSKWIFGESTPLFLNSNSLGFKWFLMFTPRKMGEQMFPFWCISFQMHDSTYNFFSKRGWFNLYLLKSWGDSTNSLSIWVVQPLFFVKEWGVRKRKKTMPFNCLLTSLFFSKSQLKNTTGGFCNPPRIWKKKRGQVVCGHGDFKPSNVIQHEGRFRNRFGRW